MEANPINQNQSLLTTELSKGSSHKSESTQAGPKAVPEPKDVGNIEDKFDRGQLEKLAQSVNDFLKASQTDLRVEIDRETKTAIFKIIRKDDQKVIKEIPPKKLLDIASRIQQMVGSLVDSSA